MAFGFIGACRGDELTNLTTDNVKDDGTEIVVRILKTKTKKRKLFQIDGSFAEIVREYFKLRPPNVPTNRVFVQYRCGKCTCQVMGKNTIAKIPKEVAKYLGLPNHERYTGHGFRRTSTTILANTGVGIDTVKRLGPWDSTKVCEGYIQDSLAHKRKIGSLISNAFNLPSTSNIGGTGEVEAKRKAPLMSISNDINLPSTSRVEATPKFGQERSGASMSIAVESSSQISVTRMESVSNDELGGFSGDALSKKYSFLSTRKTLYFTSQGQSLILMST